MKGQISSMAMWAFGAVFTLLTGWASFNTHTNTVQDERITTNSLGVVRMETTLNAIKGTVDEIKTSQEKIMSKEYGISWVEIQKAVEQKRP